MNEPWFRKWMFGCAPICWQGGAVLLITYPVAIACLWVFLLESSSPVVKDVCFGIFLANIVISNGIVIWKLEQNFGN